MPPKIGDKEQFDDNYAYKVIKILKESLPLENIYFRLLRKLGRFNGSKLKRQIDILIREKYLSSKPGDRRRVYYMVTSSGEKWFRNQEQRIRKKKEARQFAREIFALKRFQDGMEQTIKAEGPRTRGSWQKIPFYLPKDKPKYKGSITIEWKLMSKDEQRRLKELSKLTPEEKARRKEEFWQAVVANHYKRESLQKPKVEIPKNFFENR